MRRVSFARIWFILDAPFASPTFQHFSLQRGCSVLLRPLLRPRSKTFLPILVSRVFLYITLSISENISILLSALLFLYTYSLSLSLSLSYFHSPLIFFWFLCTHLSVSICTCILCVPIFYMYLYSICTFILYVPISTLSFHFSVFSISFFLFALFSSPKNLSEINQRLQKLSDSFVANDRTFYIFTAAIKTSCPADWLQLRKISEDSVRHSPNSIISCALRYLVFYFLLVGILQPASKRVNAEKDLLRQHLLYNSQKVMIF